MANEQTIPNNTLSILGQGVNKVKSLFKTKDNGSAVTAQNSTDSGSLSTVYGSSSTSKNEKETYNAWGVRWSGNTEANVTALSPALQACYTTNIKEQQANMQIVQAQQKKIKEDIENYEKDRKKEEDNLNDQRKRIDGLNESIDNDQKKIDDIKSGDTKDIMAKINFVIGAIITSLLALYLFVFYSSASFSAFFGNNNIEDAGSAILNAHCFSEAINNGLGQLLFILLMPVIFLGLGFLIHQFGESDQGFAKYFKICSLYLVTFIFDALLAFEISQKVYDYTTLSVEPYTVSMAFNSPDFWIVIFAGFVAYVIWGLVFDFTLDHFDQMNTHTKEIQVLENNIKNAQLKIDKIEQDISSIKGKITSIDATINNLKASLLSGIFIDKNLLKNAMSQFFMGWVSYMKLAGKSNNEIDMANNTYNQFISTI